jgi:PD-(D/E)XK nuclease superfamily protein
VLTTDQKGAIAEGAIALAALELGIAVSKPLVERPYDFIFELGTQLVRVQCKWAVRHGDVVAIRCYGARRNADGLLRRLYSADEIDAFAAYCAELRRCYFFRSPTRNNQRLGINWAEQYEFGATLGRFGAIAQ